MIRLVASDFDGTLLRDDKTISDRTRALVHELQDAGIIFVPASGRQLSNFAASLERLDFQGTILSANGALSIDVPNMSVRHAFEIDLASMHTLVSRLKERVPTVRVAVARDLGRRIVAEEGYSAFLSPDDDERPTPGIPEESTSDILSVPTLKILVRAPGWTVHDLYEQTMSLDIPRLTVIDGGAPFLEVMGDGVNKGAGLAKLCASLGIHSSEVLAIGDWLNDVEMLEWAGTAVAVANAHPRVHAVADRVTASNNEDGVATVLAEVLASHKTR